MERDWYKLAERAKKAIGDVKSPGVMGRRESAAESLGIARQTLRNYISAYDFVQRVRGSDPELADIVRAMPSLAAEIYNRWWSRDKVSAANHARQAVRERLTVRQIVAAHKNSSGPVTPGPDMLHDLIERVRSGKPRGRVRPDIEATFDRQHFELPSLTDIRAEKWDHPLAKALGVENILLLSGRHRPGAIALVQVPGLALSDGIRRQWRAVLARALAAAHFFPLVLVLVPNQDDLAQLIENIPFTPVPTEHLTLLDNTFDARLGWALARSAAPRVLDAGEHGGGVLFSSLNTFFDDFYAG